jgi:hypothetical protein
VPTEMGEYVVGAYLKMVKGCDHVGFNVRPPGGGIKGLGELDVVGMHFGSATAYLCEVATHIDGLNYGKGNQEVFDKVVAKLRRQREYAQESLSLFSTQVFMFWSPNVSRGVMAELNKIEGLQLFTNQTYSEAVEKLRTEARRTKADTGNPFFRALQIIEHLRRV